MSGQAETIRSCVAMLARCSIGISMKDWSDLSGNLLDAAAHIERLEVSHAELVAALSECDGAIAEYERYWHGGETRGSYDGKPERRNLFTAKYRASTALSNAKALEAGNANA